MAGVGELNFLIAGTVVFVFLVLFSAYGVVSFALDLKHKIIPGIRGYVRSRRRERAERKEREEKERQLY